MKGQDILEGASLFNEILYYEILFQKSFVFWNIFSDKVWWSTFTKYFYGIFIFLTNKAKKYVLKYVFFQTRNPDNIPVWGDANLAEAGWTVSQSSSTFLDSKKNIAIMKSGPKNLLEQMAFNPFWQLYTDPFLRRWVNVHFHRSNSTCNNPYALKAQNC